MKSVAERAGIMSGVRSRSGRGVVGVAPLELLWDCKGNLVG